MKSFIYRQAVSLQRKLSLEINQKPCAWRSCEKGARRGMIPDHKRINGLVDASMVFLDITLRLVCWPSFAARHIRPWTGLSAGDFTLVLESCGDSNLEDLSSVPAAACFPNSASSSLPLPWYGLHCHDYNMLTVDGLIHGTSINLRVVVRCHILVGRPCICSFGGTCRQFHFPPPEDVA